jgi:hypothetical protein
VPPGQLWQLWMKLDLLPGRRMADNPPHVPDSPTRHTYSRTHIRSTGNVHGDWSTVCR